MSTTTIHLDNQSKSDATLVAFQHNDAGSGEFVIAWQVIKLARNGKQTLRVTQEVQAGASDSFGNAAPMQQTSSGDRWNVLDPLVLQRDTRNAGDARDIEIANAMPKGTIDAAIFRDAKLLAMKSGVPPHETATFRIDASLRIGLAQSVDEGRLVLPTLLDPSVDIRLDGREHTVVLTGGGQTPFELNVYPIEGQHVLVRERDGWEFVERKKATEAVAVIATTNDGKLILVEQYRRPVDARVIDWPAGLVGDDGENDPAKVAKKELEEETGFTCASVEFLAKSPTSPGITSELVSFYRAQSVSKKGEAEEEITVYTIARDEMRSWLAAREREGIMIDVKVWAGLYFEAVSS